MATPGLAQCVLDANGNNGTAEIAHNLQNIAWAIQQVSVDAGGVCTVHVEVNGQPCTSTVTGASPLTAHNPPSIEIGGHDTMQVVVSAGPPGAHVIVSYYYDEVQV